MAKPIIMFRTRLLLVGLLLLGLITLMGGVAFWASDRFHHQMVRIQLAHDVRTGYLELAAQLNPLFHRPLDEEFHQSGGIAKLRIELESTLDRIRRLVAREVLHTGNEERDDEELAMLARIERQITSILNKTKTAMQLAQAGRTKEAQALLDEIHEVEIHRDFRDLVSAALARENREVALADQTSLEVLRTLDGVALASLLTAVLLGLGALLGLRRRLSEPLEALMAGTQKVAEGDLTYRMPMRGQDEFARIGANFNAMTQELERNRAAAEQAKQQLEQRVAERTEQLGAANAALARSDQARRAFFADISHELRTPLTVIRGEAQFALRGDDKPAEALSEALRRVLEQSTHLSRLVDDLLFIARSDAGEVRLERSAVSLNGLLASACADADTLSRPQGHSVRFEELTANVVVTGDPVRLRLLFMILLDNAIRYSPPGSEIQIRLVGGPGGVQACVTDQGIGIPPEERDIVFERFYRGSNASSLNQEGLGLGLPMAKAIVAAHGGDISAGSGVEGGTVLTVTLPAAGRLRVAA